MYSGDKRLDGVDKATEVDPAEGTQEYEGPWRALRVKGPMELTMTGVLHALTGPLKEAGVPIFALSTWYVLLLPWRGERR